MRHYEFTRKLDEATGNPGDLDKETIKAGLNKAGVSDENIKETGNKLFVLVDVPEDATSKNAYREEVLGKLLVAMQKLFPNSGARHVNVSSLGSLGGIMFNNSPIGIGVKEAKVQGGGSSGKANEENLRSLLQILIMDHGSINVTFVDKVGRELKLKDCNDVVDASMDVADRQKADLILKSKSGQLPISLKQVNADQWESADSLFGKRAKEIVEKLQREKVIRLSKFKEDDGRVYYQLSKEIVVEPTQEETMNAIFGSDLLNKGGVVIQTFKEHHFEYDENNIRISCDYVIKKKEDIPTSHLMVWLIRNNMERNNPIPGLRTLGVTLNRGIGKKGNKDVVLVDKDGNVVNNPNQGEVDYAQHRKSINKSYRDYQGASAVGRA